MLVMSLSDISVVLLSCHVGPETELFHPSHRVKSSGVVPLGWPASVAPPISQSKDFRGGPSRLASISCSTHLTE